MEEEQKQPQPQSGWVNSEYSVPEIYGNSVHVSWSLFDVRFAIGQLVPKKEADLDLGFVIEKRGAVTIAWPQVKNLRNVLVDLVDRFEKVNGEIKPLLLPPSGPTVP